MHRCLHCDRQHVPFQRLVLAPILLALMFLLLTGWSSVVVPRSSGAQDATPIPTPTPRPTTDGTLISATLILDTPYSTYYSITYWSDGLRVNGFMGRPKRPGPHPALIFNRGGVNEVGALTGQDIVPFVEAGYVVVASQYRGNGGSEGREEFGGADVHDVMNLIPLLQAQPDVDTERIGMVGRSRGGMMAYLALKQDTLDGTSDIKVAVTVGGISDLVAWGEFAPHLVTDVYIPVIGASPYDAPQLFEARSAIDWPELINAPLLLQHGGADDTVPVAQTTVLADQLLAAGKTVQTIVYPGDDHPLTNNQGGYPDALAWLAQYLGDDGVDRSFTSHQQAMADVGARFAAQQP